MVESIDMEPNILLAQLRALAERSPDLSAYSPTSKDQMIWLAQAHALISRWNANEGFAFKNACDFLSSTLMRDSSITKIFGTLHRAVADLELILPAGTESTFGAGDVYDFFQTLNKVISSAEKSLFIIDPYLDQTVFDHYLVSRQENVAVRLLLNHNAEKVVPSANMYIRQHGPVLELKQSSALHDRVIFVDGYVCWLIGQSLKDAAKAKPTYLVQAPPDVVSEKLKNYEEIWSAASTL
jgi:hypothetical protein